MSRDHLPLHGIRVLDMTGGLGTYCGRLLADFGADVVKIEPPEGVRSRGIPPFIDDEPGIDRSLRFLYFEANKRGIVLDVSSPDAESELRQLAAEVDVILVTPSAQHPVSGFDPVSESISWAPKTAIVICITPFGLTGPYREWRGTHLTSYAMSGLLVSQGTPEGPPVVIPGDQMHTHISTNAAIAVMTALRARDQVGGQFADLSAHEILFAGHFPFNRYSTSNFIPEREAIEPNQSGGIWECSDGLVEFFVSTDKHWQGLMTLLGDPESLSDPTLANPNTRYDRREEVIAALGPLVKAIDREDFVARGQRLGVPCALLNTIGEFVNDPQPRSRDFLTITLLPDGREVEMPGAPYRSTEPLLDLYRRAAPALGEETVSEVLTSWAAPHLRRPGGKPLSQIRVLSFGTAIAGAFSGSVLADLGADVVKIESPTLPDNLRRRWYPDEPPTQEPSGANTSDMYATVNHTQRSLSMNMKDPAAVELFLALVARADVVVDNFGASVMDSWGLGYDRLAAENAELVQISLTGFGHATGPRSHYLAYGSVVSSFVGLTRSWGYSHQTHFDFASEAHGVLAVLAALSAREQTRRGVVIDLSEIEVAAVIMAPLVLDYTVNGRESVPIGNRVPGSIWSGVMPCLGVDAWIAIEAETLDDWSLLTEVVDRPDLSQPPDAAATAQFEAALTAWLADQTPLHATRALQAAGIASAPVQNVEDLYRDPQLRARDAIVQVEHPDLGPTDFPAPPHRLSLTPPAITRGAPRLGEHGDEILGAWLGLSADELDALAASGAFWRPGS